MLMDIGISHLEKERIREAVEFFTEVIILFEKFPDAYEYRAKCYMKLVRTNRKASVPC